jgi:hypothetical protein
VTKPKPPAQRRKTAGVTFDTVRRLGLALPQAEEGTAYGTPALRVRGKLFARLREDGESLVLRTDLVERDLMLAANPKLFFITEHYREYPWVLVRLSAVEPDELQGLLQDAWRRVAPKRLAQAPAQPRPRGRRR